MLGLGLWLESVTDHTATTTSRIEDTVSYTTPGASYTTTAIACAVAAVVIINTHAIVYYVVDTTMHAEAAKTHIANEIAQTEAAKECIADVSASMLGLIAHMHLLSL